MAKQVKTAEQVFLEYWEEFGFSGSDLTREYQFYPSRRWRFDFAFPSRKVAVEIDGRGRHQTVTGIRSDCEKHNTACKEGWVVLHFPATDVSAKNSYGERLLDAFMDLLLEILQKQTHRASNDQTGIHKEVEQLPTMPTVCRDDESCSIQRVDSSRPSTDR